MKLIINQHIPTLKGLESIFSLPEVLLANFWPASKRKRNEVYVDIRHEFQDN